MKDDVLYIRHTRTGRVRELVGPHRKKVFDRDYAERGFVVVEFPKPYDASTALADDKAFVRKEAKRLQAEAQQMPAKGSEKPQDERKA